MYLLLPRLLATAVGRRYRAEFDAFIQLVLAEGFYQHLVDRLRVHRPDLPVKDPKKAFFTHVLYSKNHALTSYRRAFNKCFPRVNEALLEIVTRVWVDEQTGEVTSYFLNLAIMLQQDESKLFLDQMVPQLHQELGEDAVLLTLHDGFYCLPAHLETVRRVMVAVLTAATGFLPTVRTSAEKRAGEETRGTPVLQEAACPLLPCPQLLAPAQTSPAQANPVRFPAAA